MNQKVFLLRTQTMIDELNEWYRAKIKEAGDDREEFDEAVTAAITKAATGILGEVFKRQGEVREAIPEAMYHLAVAHLKADDAATRSKGLH